MSKGKNPSSKTAKDLGIQPFSASSASSSTSGGRGYRGAPNRSRGHSSTWGSRGNSSGSRGRGYGGLWNNSSVNSNQGGKWEFSPCSPLDNPLMFPWFRKSCPWGENRKIFRELEPDHWRQGNLKYYQRRLENSNVEFTTS